MKNVNSFAALTGILLWVGGIAATSGFWPTAGAIVLPPYAYYNLVRQVMVVYTPELLP